MARKFQSKDDLDDSFMIQMNWRTIRCIIIGFLLTIQNYAAIGQSSPPQSPPPPTFEGFNYPPTFLQQLTFHSPVEGITGWIRIFKDPLECPECIPDPVTPDEPLSGEFSTITAGSVKSVPIAYVSDYTGKVSAKFSRLCDSPIYIRGEGPNGYNLPAKPAIITGDQMFYPETAFNQKFPENEVKYWNKFTIKWYYSPVLMGPPGPNDEVHFATTTTPIYVTHKKPISLGGNPVYLTPLHIGCSNANGKIIQSEIVESIYSEFTDQCVKKLGSTKCMSYWGGANISDFSAECRGIKGLLAYEDAACGEWAEFLQFINFIQGITNLEVSIVKWKEDYILPTEYWDPLDDDAVDFFGAEITKVTPYTLDDGFAAMFYVKDWSITSSNLRDFQVEYEMPGTLVHTLANGNVLYGGDITGVKGQGNSNPRSVFENHAIVKYTPALGFPSYYDPSYGSDMVISKEAYEAANFDGFGARLFYDLMVSGGGLTADFIFIWPIETNTTSTQMIITP